MESQNDKRTSQKIDVYFNIVDEISSLSNSSTLKVGCMALKKDFTKIASFGYNGSYKKAPINPTTGTEEESLEPGKSGFIHAEINMVAKFRENDPENYIVLLTHSPCKDCMKVLINSGFLNVYWIHTYRESSHLSIFNTVNVKSGDIKQLKKDYKNIINGI